MITLDQAISDMKSCYQIPGRQTVWEHGESVARHLEMIYDYVKGGAPFSPELPRPCWLDEKKHLISKMLYDKEVLLRYALFHDIGKPYCITKDPDG